MDENRTQQEHNVKVHVPANNNKLLEELINRVNANVELRTLWRVMNVNALDRLHMTDHGVVHFQIVSNIGIKLARMLVKAGNELSITKNFGLSTNHGELVVFLGCILHDLGMSISREGHEEFSLFLANNLMHELLDFLPVDERTIVISETLHSIISHRKGGKPITLEAGIVRVADALDMTKGRSRTSYEAEIFDIHSVSHQAIDSLDISEGIEKPILITITLNNSAGIFQVDDLFKSKINGSGLEKFISVHAYIEGEKEKRLLGEFRL